jgi:hypothetical protein
MRATSTEIVINTLCDQCGKYSPVLATVQAGSIYPQDLRAKQEVSYRGVSAAWPIGNDVRARVLTFSPQRELRWLGLPSIFDSDTRSPLPLSTLRRIQWNSCAAHA